METVWIEVLFILLLILMNGFFSGSEIAVVSSRRSRVSQLEKDGKLGARIVAGWLKEPEEFLATVQIMVTLVGALASAVGGAAAVVFLTPHLDRLPFLSGGWSQIAAIGIVVLPITYLSLVVGELVPKSLALAYRERIAVIVALPISALSKIARPLVSLLTLSTRSVLFLLGRRDMPKEMFATEEDIRFLIKEGGILGNFDATEQQMIPKIFDFSELKVREVMIPREQITAINVNTPRELLVTRVAEEGFTRLPVYQGTLDRIIGILHMKDLIHIINLGRIIILQDLVRPAVFVHETTLAKDLLKLFQKQRLHLAIVQDPNGRTLGLVTIEDLIERIVGDIRDEHDVSENP
ncbi:MAG: hypothetical protein A2636_00160 [Elusimicrobia bacterium RIFCSPHIGHO2_01_FULL_64_10]|nr:MAG: hypothetical protein A2636_00160 [Elusimicrobia bacterium RIFCSPHIGHO2_01_FULL_64_10]